MLGAEIFRYVDIDRLSFKVVGKRPKIIRKPKKLVELSIKPIEIIQ